MKIGILSCYPWLKLWDNYGTLFQNFALQSYLKKQGHDTFWICCISDSNQQRIPLIKKLANVGFDSNKIYNYIQEYIFKARINKFNRNHERNFMYFLKKHISCTEEIEASSLIKNGADYDAYIVGSDSVWGSVNPVYFLGFVPDHIKKVAYAASAPWGSLNAQWQTEASKYLPRFDAVSVREDDGIAICESAGAKSVCHVIDPTLLIDCEDYMKIVKQEDKDTLFDNTTILGYFVNSQFLHEIEWKKIKELSRMYNADLKVIPLQGTELITPQKYVFTPSPSEWLNAFDKCFCVLTNSFHGTLFAIIMKKQFLVITQKGKSSIGNCRFHSILNALGLQSRIYDPSIPMKLQMDLPINWNDVSMKLTKLRKNSYHFLKNALS